MSEAIVSDRARGIVMTIGVLSLVATVGALVYGRKLSPREISPRDSYGRGPIGTRVFVEALPRLGISAHRETEIARVQASEYPVLFLAPDSDSVTIDGSTFTLSDVIARRSENGRVSVLVLPKWELSSTGVAEPTPRSEVHAAIVASGIELELTRTGNANDRPKERALTTFGVQGTRVLLPHPQTVVGGHHVMASIAEGSLVVSNSEQTVYVVSDPDLVANYDVHRADHALLMVSLLRSLASRTVVVDETFHGRTERKSLAEALGEWPGVLVLIQGAFLAAASLLAGRRRFGLPRRAAPAYGRGPAEGIAVAADVLTLGRLPTRLALRYVELMIRDVHRRAGLRQEGHSVSTLDAARALDRLATQRGRTAHALALLDDARANVGEGKGDLARQRALALAARAHALRAEWLGDDPTGEA